VVDVPSESIVSGSMDEVDVGGQPEDLVEVRVL